MKKWLALISLILVCLLCGCSDMGDEIGQLVGYDPTDSALLKTEDSVVEFSIYPTQLPYGFIDKFDRQGFLSLSDRQKSIYIVLDNAIFDMQTGYIGVGNCSYRDLQIALQALNLDRPEYFWLPYEYTFKTTGQYRQIQFAETDSDWYCSKEERERYEGEIRAVLEDLNCNINKELSDYERELIIHDLICSLTSYDREALSSPLKENPFSWTAAGVFSKGKSVCSGYAEAFQMTCFALGIDAVTLSGFTTEAHMWNSIKIDGKWYHVDLTANDSEDKGFKAYFNATDKILELDRITFPTASEVDDSVLEKGNYNIFVPRCNSLENNYFVKNSLYVTNKSQLKSTVISIWTSVAADEKNEFEICLDPEMGFKCGTEDINDYVDLKDCAKEVNKILPHSKKLKTFSHGGLQGSPAFTVSW